MKEIKYEFKLSKNEKITMITSEVYNVNDIFYDTFAYIFFDQGGEPMILIRETLHEACRMLNILGKKALEKKFYTETMSKDIGLIYNESFYKTVASKYKDHISEVMSQEIEGYILWYVITSISNMQAWLYTNQNDEIIFLIAPVYPFTFSSKRIKGFIPYDDWIKSYKPFVKRIISPETAKEWIKQTDEIMALIQKNSNTNSKKNVHDDVVRPKNGQKALDNSIAFKQTSSVRVSASDNQFVVLTKTKDNVSHGHVALWHELELAMQDALIDAGLVTQYGKIISKN
jgi:hypothetical protein